MIIIIIISSDNVRAKGGSGLCLRCRGSMTHKSLLHRGYLPVHLEIGVVWYESRISRPRR